MFLGVLSPGAILSRIKECLHKQRTFDKDRTPTSQRVIKLFGNQTLERRSRRWGDNIKMNIIHICLSDSEAGGGDSRILTTT